MGNIIARESFMSDDTTSVQLINRFIYENSIFMYFKPKRHCAAHTFDQFVTKFMDGMYISADFTRRSVALYLIDKCSCRLGLLLCRI